MKKLHLLIFLCIAYISWGQTNEHHEKYNYQINKSTSPIKIDGVIDESEWGSIAPFGDFSYSFPVDDKVSEQTIQTVAKMTYDDNYIYVAIKCYGQAPFIKPSLKRDNNAIWDGDNVSVTFDPFNEKTNAFLFMTNPSGVQTDMLIGADTGTRNNPSGGGFYSAWDNKWVCSSQTYDDHWTTEMAIPFKSLRYGKNTSWGVNFLRGEPKTNSWHTWARVPVQLTGVDLGYNGRLDWDAVPPQSKSNISVIPYALGSVYDANGDGVKPELKTRIGGDAKVSITPTLNLDLTYNPDFSQVDVDEQVTNLTSFNIRFPERRLFFLENSDVFSEFGIPPMRPFFSRKIGLDDRGNAIPILYGARLTGNVNKDLRIGISNLQTKSTDQFNAQNYSSVSINQRIFGRTTLKGYLHNRQAFDEGKLSKFNYNRILGGELDYRSISGEWRFNGGGGMSLTKDISNKNYTYHGIASYIGTQFSAYTNLMVIGDNYISDMGFFALNRHYDSTTGIFHRKGYGHSYSRLRYNFFPEGGIVVNHGPSLQYVVDYTEDEKEVFVQRLSPSYHVAFRNTSELRFDVAFAKNKLLYPFAFVSQNHLPVGEYSSNFFGVNYKSDQRKDFTYEVGMENGSFYDGKRSQYSAEINFRRQPYSTIGVKFIRNDLDLGEYGKTALTLIGPKFEFNFSKDLFWTSFLQYNTQRDNFNINSRLQWQFKPLSNLFIVYSDNYAIDVWGPKNRALVIKMNYWLNL